MPDGAVARSSSTASARTTAMRRWHRRRGRCSTASSKSRAGSRSRRGRAVRRDDRHRHEPARPARRRRPACLDGLTIDTLHSHLACADEDIAMNARQLRAFLAKSPAAIPAKRYSLANSAGICLGRDYSFDLVRPGLALYGGIPRARSARAHIRQVARVEAQVVQRRTIRAGESCGYGAHLRRRGATPKRRSSTSAMPTAICAASRRAGAALPASTRCR